jgi:hypothetical protein
MSLYNMLFGVNAAAPVLLAMLGIDSNDVPRFRDCFLAGDRIAIHTRTGGGNRDYYEHSDRCRDNYPEYFGEGKEAPSGPWNADLRQLPGFEYDEDDDYDNTYATFYFKVPEKFKHLLEKLPQGENPAQRWQDTLEKLKTATPDDPQVKKLTAVLAPMFEALQKGEGGTFEV